MKDVSGQLKRLESLINALIAEQQLLKKDNEKLRAELNNCQTSEHKKDDELQKIKAQLNNARLARGLEKNQEDSQMTKAKLSSLMREIDRCIALLNE